MIFVKLEDFTNSAEAVVFSDLYQRTSNLWSENKVLIVEGKASYDGERLKIICNDVKEI